jgi:hypothetical protein
MDDMRAGCFKTKDMRCWCCYRIGNASWNRHGPPKAYRGRHTPRCDCDETFHDASQRSKFVGHARSAGLKRRTCFYAYAIALVMLN